MHDKKNSVSFYTRIGGIVHVGVHEKLIINLWLLCGQRMGEEDKNTN
jgi:hypothetical protein